MGMSVSPWIRAETHDHKKQVQHLSLSADHTHFISASLDKTAKLFDTATLAGPSVAISHINIQDDHIDIDMTISISIYRR
jgi:WD40 repeat protein